MVPVVALALVAGCAPVKVNAPVKAAVPVASPADNRLGDVHLAADAPVSVATSQPVSNSGAQAGSSGDHSLTVNVGALKVDGLALAVSLVVLGMIYLRIHGHIRAYRARKRKTRRSAAARAT